MTSLQIECFLSVVENMSFSAAAKKRFISQPSISKHIHNLETELGATLFDRTGHNLQLTYMGQLYADFFKESLRRMDEIKLENPRYFQKLTGTVKVGAVSSMNTSNVFAEILDSCISKHPNITISTDFLPFQELEKALLSDEVDIIIMLKDFLSPIPGVVVQELGQAEKSIFYHEDLMPVDSNDNLTPLDFKDQTFLVLGPEISPMVASKVIEYCEDYGFTPSLKYVPNIESMIGGVRHRRGVAIFDKLMDWGYEKIKSVPLDNPHEVVVAWKKSNVSRSVHIVVNELLFHFKTEKDAESEDCAQE